MAVLKALFAIGLLLLASACIISSAHVTKTEEEKLNVHIVPHTHDDVGWLRTVDQYYIERELLHTSTNKYYKTCLDLEGFGLFLQLSEERI